MADMTLTDMRFESYTSKVAVLITSGGEYTFDNCFFDQSGTDDIEIDSGVSTPVTIILTNGTTALTTARVDNQGSSTFTIQNNVTVSVTAQSAADASAVANARVLLLADTGGDLPYEDSVTITRSGQVATVTHTAHGLATGQQVWISGANQTEYNGVHTVTVTTANAYTFPVPDSFPLVRARNSALWSDTDDGKENYSAAITVDGDVTVPLPTNKSGDLLLLLVVITDDNENLTATPDGWAPEATWDTTGFQGKGYLYSKVSEDEVEVDVNFNVGSRGEMQTFGWAIRNADSVEVTSNLNTGHSSPPNPPNHVGAGSEDALWLAIGSVQNVATSVTAPTNYSNLTFRSADDASGATNDCSVGVSERLLTATSENPGAFSWTPAPSSADVGEITVKINPTNAAPTTPATGTITATGVVLSGIADSSGQLQDTAFNFTSSQPVTGRVRRGSYAPYFQTGAIAGTIESTGFSALVFLVGDGS